jgi:hypothetical protein
MNRFLGFNNLSSSRCRVSIGTSVSIGIFRRYARLRKNLGFVARIEPFQYAGPSELASAMRIGRERLLAGAAGLLPFTFHARLRQAQAEATSTGGLYFFAATNFCQTLFIEVAGDTILTKHEASATA